MDMSNDAPGSGPWQRPALLRWLCISSGINQLVCVICYFTLLLVASSLRGTDVNEVEGLVRGLYAGWVQPDQMDRLISMAKLLHAQGVLLMGILLARTIVRAVGTWRMWNGHLDGLHIYISAQLIGVLAPMWLVDRSLFDFFGFIMVLNWCYLYWSVRRSLH